MPGWWRLALLLVLLAAGAPPAGAALLGDASVPYSAERTVTVDGRSYTGMVFHIPGHDRHEQTIAGIAEVILLDAHAKQGFLILPVLNSYVAFGFPPLLAELDDPGLRRSPVGHERLAGREAIKYRIDHWAADGSHAEGYVWASGEGVLLRIDGSVTRKNGGHPVKIHMEIAHLAVGPQDPRLFALPAGLTPLPGRALEELLGARSG